MRLKLPKPKMVSSLLRRLHCNFENLSYPCGGAEVRWNGLSERLTAPYAALLTNELVFKDSGFLV